MKKANGFSLLEMLIVAGLVAVVMAAALSWMNDQAKEAQYKKLSSDQAKEMYMLAKATENWMVANSKTWTIDTRMTTTIDALIGGAYLPQNFARRATVGGVVANGVSPFGDRYNVAAMASMLSGKRVHRGVVWESGTPIGWSRYARVGLAQGSEPANGSTSPPSKVNTIKQEVARSLSADLRHPAPAIATVSTATVRGASGSWTQDVTQYLGSGVTFVTPSVVLLAGWPEYGSVLPPTTTANYGTCVIREAWCSLSGESQFGTKNQNCRISGSTPRAGVCFAGETKVKDIPHCAGSGQIVSVPEIGSSVTFGSYVEYGELAISDSEMAECYANHPGDQPPGPPGNNVCGSMRDAINGQPTYESSTIGTISINNVTVMSYMCSSSGYWVDQPGGFGNGYYEPWSTWGPAGPNGASSSAYPDALCCTGG